MKADLLLGLQWGDEGKGKIVDESSVKENDVEANENSNNDILFKSATNDARKNIYFAGSNLALKNKRIQSDAFQKWLDDNQRWKQTITEKKTIYTAISRAEKKCIIISNEYDFVNLQKNNKKLNMKVSIFMEESNTYEL